MDRIYDAYNGSMGAEFMHKTRERLHWICSQVWGSRVLDVGCSQGVGPMILARMGYAVDGIDINPEAIAFANDQLAKEPANIRAKVTYATADFGKFVPPKDRKYDVITMSEVLEHLVRPQDFVRKAFSILPEKGRFIVTVPFGINDDPDHRQTFYLTTIYSLLHPFFEVAVVKIFNGWIGLVGRRRAEETKEAPTIPFNLMRQAEEAFFKIERPLRDGTLAVKNQRQDLRAKQEKLADDLRAAEEARAEAEAKVAEADEARGRLSASEGEVQALQTSLEVERKVSSGLQDQVNMLKAMLQFATARPQVKTEETRLLEYSQEVKDLRGALDRKQDEAIRRAEELGRLAGRVEHLESSNQQLAAERESLKKKAAELESAAAAAKTAAASEQAQRQQLSEEVAKVNRQVESQASRIKALEGELSDRSAKLSEREADLSKNEAAYAAELKAKQEAQAKASELSQQVEEFKAQEGERAAELTILRKENTSLSNQLESVKKSRDEFSQRAWRLGKDGDQLKVLLNKNQKALAKTERRLDALSKSKLGRLTLRYWKLKDAVKARLGMTARPVRPNVGAAGECSVTNTEPGKKNAPNGDDQFFAKMSAKANGMPESNGCRYYRRFKTRIGIICDRFYWDSVKDAADFVYLTPANWRGKVKSIDCFMYVTAWRGVNGEWPDLFHEKKPNRLLLYEIIEACRTKGKKTIFYSKEDPPHFSESVNIAKRCDYVFTTCEEIIPKYRAACGHDRIATLKFGINPLYHNPIGMGYAEKEPGVIFSGSWSVQYPKRCADLGAIFDGILTAGRRLEIIDRNYARRDNPAFALPERYRPFQHPSIDHDALQKVHKLFDWAVNINSITDSRTMFANRVYELQAAGNLLLSNFSLGVSREFPGVFIVGDAGEAQAVLSALSPEDIHARQIAGVRRVMTGETCYDRIGQVLSAIGLDGAVPTRKILVIADKITERVRSCFDRQSYPAKRLVDMESVSKSDFAAADIVAFFGQDYIYDRHYLEDMSNGFKYTACDYVTKAAFQDGDKEIAGPEQTYVSKVSDKYRTLFWRESFKLSRLKSVKGAFACPNGYASDRLGCVRNPPAAAAAHPGVSVIIPTYRPNTTVFEAADSALAQELPGEGVEVLLCVNGGDSKWKAEIESHYAKEPRVRVLFTERRGANAGRNLGVAAAKRPLLAFLDDDDYYTPGYLQEMARGMTAEDVNLAVGMLGDLDERSGQVVHNRIIKRTFRTVGEGLCSDWLRLSPVFSTFTCKLYRTDFFRRTFGTLSEDERHSEDVVFWCEHIGQLAGFIYVAAPESMESYVRRYVPNSLSRPTPDREYAFYVTDRLQLLDRLERILLDPSRTLTHKRFVLEKVRSQTSFMQKFVDAAPAEFQSKARAEIFAHRNLFLNKSRFATRKAIAFCHNFAPFVDASAFVATKRLQEIEELEGGPLRWHVISQEMDKVRTRDELFQRFYADFQFWKQTMVTGPSAFMPELQKPFANAALNLVKDDDAEVIYSRSLFVGSHIAAYYYKKAHPKTKWYAEFSDPAAYGVDNKPRACKGSPTWFYIEQMVYVLADKIIFTNANQMEFMLSYNPRSELNDRIRARAIVRHHPVLPRDYCGIIGTEYALDPGKINIGYFGTFYMTRKADDMLRLLENHQVVLHVFTTKPDELRPQLAAYGQQVRVNSTVSQLEVLNLGSRMDYLYLGDTEFPGRINPFLPSKYADYLATGTPIIAKIQSGSVISNEDRPNVLKIGELTADFVSKLQKKTRAKADDLAVSVIIPTWRKNNTLSAAVKSVLAQNYPQESVRVFVCVNGGDESYRKELEQTYAKEPRVSVLYTETPGPNAGRNLGLRAAQTPLLTFLDDDDTLTAGYLRELAGVFQNPQVNISFGRMVDQNVKTGGITTDTYINRALATAGVGTTARYVKASSLLSTLCGKMYRTEFFRRTLGLLDESERHTEDMLFWAERFDRLAGLLYFCDSTAPEAYMRHVTSNSLSRPSSTDAYAFYVTDRIRIIKRLQSIYSAARLPDHRKMLESKLRAQKRVMRDHIETLSAAERTRAEKEVGELLP